MNTLRVGIIGAGGIAAKLHLPELQTTSGVEVAVLAERKSSRLDRLCRQFNVPRWTQSYEEVIADPAIDAVVIALPHPLHVKYGLMALDAGKHVHMQKPLSTSLDDAEAFVRAAENSSQTVLCLPYVARPQVLAARQMIAKGRLGKVASAHARFSHGGPEVYYATIQQILDEEPDDALWFFDADQADVGALFDMGVYSIAHLVALCGSVTAVTCRMTTVAKPTRLEDTAALLLDFESGAIGSAETGWCDGARTYGWSVHGTSGKLVNPPLTSELRWLRPTSLVDEDAPLAEEIVNLDGLPDVHSHQHWVDCIREGRQPPMTNARMARHVTEIMLCGLRSAREGRTLPVESRL
ncbi:MAG: Gfo/Idh/MocA family oxidoreductase [Planctomycetaceae bacterium]|nr:Gfo/Idh/MocA family oxidoreductase [Planctomycetaceae bacterium]